MINAASPTPLYQQVTQFIRNQVDSGAWPPDAQIPSERELCQQYGISRTTVRLAINESVNAGLLRRIHGKGTYVAPPVIRQPLFRITDFAQTMRARGLEPAVVLLEAGPAPPADGPAAALGAGDLLRFRYLGLGSGEPMAHYESWVPAALGAGLAAEMERREAVGNLMLVNELLARRHGWPWLQADQTYAAALAPAPLARVLGVPAGSPAFQVTSRFHDPAGRPVEYRVACYRGDAYQFQVIRRLDFSHAHA